MRNLLTRTMHFLLGVACVFLAGTAFADGAPSDIGGLVGKLQTSVLVPILNVVVAISYLAGAGFIVAAIFKFKAHKDNPTQVTVGTPIMLLFVGVALLFFPEIVKEVMGSLGFGTSNAGSLSYNTGSVTS